MSFIRLLKNASTNMSLKEYFQLLVFETKVSVPVIPFMSKFLYELVKCDFMNVLVNFPGNFFEIGQVTCRYSLSGSRFRRLSFFLHLLRGATQHSEVVRF